MTDRHLGRLQELQAGRPEPSAAHVEHGAAEMAPGTPAQQVPPLPMLLPTPSAQESMPHQSSGAVIFMQNSHIPPSQRNSVPRMIPPHGQMRPPPLLEAGYPRPINVRREGGPMPPFAVQPPPHLPQTQVGLFLNLSNSQSVNFCKYACDHPHKYGSDATAAAAAWTDFLISPYRQDGLI